MKKKELFFTVIIIFLLLFTFIQFGYSKSDLRYLSIADGLSNNTVTSIIKDHRGFMWFGTYDGLNRYDGYTLKTFRNIAKDTSSLRDNFVTDVKEDKLGRLWVGTKKGICVLDEWSSHFRSIRITTIGQKGYGTEHRDSSQVNCITMLGQHTVLAGTGGSGLVSIETSSLQGRQIPLFDGNKRVTQYNVKAILAESPHVVWLGVHGFGICRYDVGKQKIIVEKKIEADINSLIKIREGVLMLGTDSSILTYSIRSRQDSSVKAGNGFGRVLSLMKDHEGLIWVTTDGQGVRVLDPSGRKEISLDITEDRKGIPSDAIYCIYEDEANRKWIGTFRGGIAILDPHTSQFSSVKIKGGKGRPSENFIFSFCSLPDGNILIGTDGSGIFSWNRKQNTFRKFNINAPAPDPENITAMLTDGHGNLWVASYGGGVLKVDLSSQKGIRISGSDRMRSDYAWRLFKDKSGTIWATNNNGLYQYDEPRQLLRPVFNNTNGVSAIAEDDNHHLWIGSQNNVYEIDKTGKLYRSINVAEAVLCIFIDSQGEKWIGTKGKGLIRLSGKNKRSYTEETGLSNNNVLSILQDNSGKLWVSTFSGLNRIDTRQGKTTRFYEVDGLQSNQFYYNAAMKSADGEIFFGGINGLTYFLPGTQSFNESFPKMVLTDIRVMNSTVLNEDTYFDKATGKIEIPFEKAVLSIDYAALEYSFPKKINYAYRLKGWDTDWNDARTVRTANYSGLREGNYILQIRSTNAMGKWNTRLLEIPIVILPPWYRSWIAYICYTLLFLGIGFLIVHYRVRQLKVSHNIQIAEMKYEQEKEMNEKKLSFFTNMAHEVRAPLSLIINPVREMLTKGITGSHNFELSVVYNNALRLLRMTDQLLLFRSTESDTGTAQMSRIDFLNLCREVFISFTNEAKLKEIHYELLCDLKNVSLTGDANKLEIVIYNLIANAIKYTPEKGEVIVRLQESAGGQMILTVKDTGPGIHEAAGEQIFERYFQVTDKHGHDAVKPGFGIGLYLVKRFVDMHSGQVSYANNASGPGTTFRVAIPMRLECQETEEQFAVKKEQQEAFKIVQEIPALSFPEPEEDQSLSVLVQHQKAILVIDDDEHLLAYIKHVFKDLLILEASSGSEGLQLIRKMQPDLILCDVKLPDIDGIELCKRVKSGSEFGHIPVILMTASAETALKLQGVRSGADDYILKPFENEMLLARIQALLQTKALLKQYFFDEITLQHHQYKISDEHREFLEKCIMLIEANLDNDDFNSSMLASKIGMSRSNLYRKVKAISDLSINEFIRLLRLRKAASMMIDTDLQIKEIAFQVGFSDRKYFREQFFKLFNLNPSEYIKKYRNNFQDGAYLHGQFSKMKK